MNLLTAHRAATRQFDNRIRRVRETQWGNATPCVDWDVRTLVEHVVAGQRQAVALLESSPAPTVDTGDTGDTDDTVDTGGTADTDDTGDLPAAWESAAEAAAEAWNAPGALDREVVLPTGPMSATGYLERRVVELTVHAWDLARAIGDDDDVPNDLAGVAVEIAQRREAELTASGRFGTSMMSVMCADDLTELLARLGRARWKSFTPAAFGG